MKIPKSLIHSMVIGLTAGTMVACSFDVVEPLRKTVTGEECPPVDTTGNNSDPYWCPACGMG